MTYTEKELDQFLHGISLSLLSKKSAQHWRYDEETAKEIEWLEVLERKVRADKADRKTEPQTENPCDGCVCDDGKHIMYCLHCKGIAWKTEPPKIEEESQTDCESCKHNKLEWFSEVCDGCSKAHSNYEPKTDCETCKHYDSNHESIACERCLDGKYSRYEPKTERSE